MWDVVVARTRMWKRRLLLASLAAFAVGPVAVSGGGGLGGALDVGWRLYIREDRRMNEVFSQGQAL